EVFIGNHHQQLPDRLQDFPPAQESGRRVGEVFEAVAGVDPIEGGKVQSGQSLRVSLGLVPMQAVGGDGIVSTTDVYPTTDKDGLEVAFSQSASIRFARLTAHRCASSCQIYNALYPIELFLSFSPFRRIGGDFDLSRSLPVFAPAFSSNW